VIIAPVIGSFGLYSTSSWNAHLTLVMVKFPIPL
jgi:hypothetical protein